MKLGTQTASLTNHLYSRMTIGEPTPVAGMGATILGWTDRHPATIIAFDGKILTLQEDFAKRVDSNGMSECQDYEYTPNPNAHRQQFKKDRKGTWRSLTRNENGRMVFGSGHGLRIGERDKYYDYSF